MERRKKHGTQAVTAILLILGILLILNLISTQLFGRMDFSEGKIYTLSKGSRDLVRNLEDPLTVKAYFSKDLPPPYNANARYLRDQLDDYKAYSHGKFTYQFVDPASEEKLEKEAQSFRIPPAQVNAVEKDKIEVKKVYMGLVFLYQDKNETIPLVQSTTGLEYDISSMIKRLTSKNRTIIGILMAPGGTETNPVMNNLRTVLERNYEVRPIDLTKNQMVPSDVKVLLAIGFDQDFPEWYKYAIDQHIMKGGKVAFLLNKVSADLQQGQAQQSPLRIDDWTKGYGFKINDDLVMDKNCGMINVQQRMGFFTISNAVNYPYFPQVKKFNPNNPMVKELENMMLFFPSTIDTSFAAAKGLKIEPLLYSSQQSKRQMGRYDINPQQKYDPKEFNEGPFILGAAITGSFKSYFADKGIPSGDSTMPVPTGLTTTQESPPDNRLVVIGDGHFPQDAYASDPSNIEFVLNMVDWLALDEALIQIRSRDVTSRPLAEVSDGVKATVKYANIFAPPILVVLIGVVRWQVRRRKKNTEL
ncbi:MAG: GldG family protein [bacterium]|nr:GldG family protein [bacterium]